MVEVEKLKALLLLFAFLCRNGDLCPFLLHIGLGQLGNKLDEEDNADNTEDVGDAVADGNEALILRGNGGLCGAECGGRGQRA